MWISPIISESAQAGRFAFSSPSLTGLALADIFMQAGSFRWLIWVLAFLFFFLVAMNLFNAWRVFRSAPSGPAGGLREALARGRPGDLSGICTRARSPLTESFRAGLDVGGGESRLDRAAVLRAWALLAEGHRFWPKCLGAYGLTVGAATATALVFEVTYFVMRFWDKIAEATRQPYLRDVVQDFVGRVLVISTVGTALFTLSVIGFLIFSLFERSVRRRATKRIMDILGAGGGRPS